MREIKFRAWLKEFEDMLRVTSLGIEGYDVITEHIEDGCDTWERKELVLMQYTGLKDKNGKEIYEGDIVKTSKEEEYNNYIDAGEPYLIKFCSGEFCFEEKDGGLIFSGEELMIKNNKFLFVEVIGNKFENPELLNG